MDYLVREGFQSFINELKAMTGENMTPLIQIIQRLLKEDLSITGQDIIADLNKLLNSKNSMIKENAVVLLGSCYLNGLVVQQNSKKAVNLFQQAAELGNASALSNLGKCYECGKGVEKDIKKALELYRQAAAEGISRALCNLGIIYEEGIHVVKDEKQAAEFYRQAAAKGNAIALKNLGLCYEKGSGVKKDIKTAVVLYQQSAARKNEVAIKNLGMCYEFGEGVEKDTKKAVELYRQAVDLGNTIALYCLGMCYYKGTGVDIDLKKAMTVFEQALARGYSQAKEKLIELGWDLISAGEVELLKELISKKYFDVLSVNAKNAYPLYIAGCYEQSEMVEFLLSQGIYFDHFSDHPQAKEKVKQIFHEKNKFQTVAIIDNVEKLFKFVEKNSTPVLPKRFESILWYAVNARRKKDGNTILHLSLMSENPNIDFIIKLLNSNPNLFMKNDTLKTVIDLLAAHKHPFLRTLGLCFKTQELYNNSKVKQPNPLVQVQPTIRGLDEEDDENSLRTTKQETKEVKEIKETKDLKDLKETKESSDDLIKNIALINEYFNISSEPKICQSIIHFMLGKLLCNSDHNIVNAIFHLERVEETDTVNFPEAQNILARLYTESQCSLDKHLSTRYTSESVIRAGIFAGEKLDESLPLFHLMQDFIFQSGIKQLPGFKSLSDPKSQFEFIKFLKNRVSSNHCENIQEKAMLLKFNSEIKATNIRNIVVYENHIKISGLC